MARPLRIEYPGAFYHVINRGNAGESIVASERDSVRFLEYLGKTVERFSIVIHTYCLMSNHYHLLIETPYPNLSLAIQWLSVSYAAYFNRKHLRSGHLFQGRFKSILVDADEYLTSLSRYIHLNPVRAKVATKPEDYRWSSYPAFIGKTEAPVWLETERLLSNFGTKKRVASQNYKAFHDEIESEMLENPAKGLVGGIILGDSEFVDWVKKTFLADRTDDSDIPQLKKLKPRITLGAIVECLAVSFGVDEQQIREKGRKGNSARDSAIYFARDLTGLSCKELGDFFGGISGAAITSRYNHVAGVIEQDKAFNRKLGQIEKRILNN
jgi:putative transposase